MSPSCSSVTALHWQRYIGTLDPAKVCVRHCDTGTQVFASLQCTHLPKRMSIGTRIPPHNRVSRQYRDGPDTRGGHALAPHQRCLLHVSIACLRRLTHRIVRIGAGISIRAGIPHFRCIGILYPNVSASFGEHPGQGRYNSFDVSGFCITSYR